MFKTPDTLANLAFGAFYLIAFGVPLAVALRARVWQSLANGKYLVTALVCQFVQIFTWYAFHFDVYSRHFLYPANFLLTLFASLCLVRFLSVHARK